MGSNRKVSFLFLLILHVLVCRMLSESVNTTGTTVTVNDTDFATLNADKSEDTSLRENNITNFKIPKILENSGVKNHFGDEGHIFNLDKAGVSLNGSDGFGHRCSAFGSCQANNSNCYCDSRCTLYNDCCLDFISSNSTREEDHVGPPILMENQVCMHSVFSGYGFLGVWTINKCPANEESHSGYDRIIFEKCMYAYKFPGDILSSFPVSDKYGNVYRNQYCAICTGVSEYRHWTAKIQVHDLDKECLGTENYIPNQEKLSLLTITRNMAANCTNHYFSVISDVLKPRFCIKQFPGHQECSYNPLNPVIGRRAYKNFECCVQNDDPGCVIDKYKCVSLHILYQKRLKQGFISAQKTYMNVLLRKTGHTGGSINNKNNTDVPKIEHTEEGCVQSDGLACGVQVFISGLVHIYTTDVTMDTFYDRELFVRAIKTYVKYVNKAQTIVEIDRFRGFFNISESEKGELIKSNCTFYVFARNPGSLENINKMIAWLNKLQMRYIEIREDCRNCFVEVSFNKSEGSCINCRSIAFFERGSVVVFQDDARSPVGSKFLIEDDLFPNKTCDRVRITLTRDKRHVGSQDVYTMFNYLCLLSYSYKEKTATYDTSVEAYLTNICLTMSCLCIVPCIVSQIRSVSLKSTAGKNMLNVLLMIFLSQALFLFAIDESSDVLFCRIIGITIHFLFLASVSWLSVSLLYITCSLIKMKLYPGQRQSSNMRGALSCMLLGYLFPFMIVCPSALNEFLDFVDLKVGYSEHGLCFPTSYPGNLITFLGPLALFLIINILCLAISIYIVHESSATVTMIKNHHRSNLAVYTKLFCISGLSWVFGFVAELSGIVFFRYCFVVLTGSQGVFLGSAFFLKKILALRVVNSQSVES